MMLAALVRASLDGALVVTLVWILNRALPRLSPATRTVLWWCAAAKFIVSLVWIAPLAIPILPPGDGPRLSGPAAPGQIRAVTVEPPVTAADSADAGRTANVVGGPSVVILSAWAMGMLLATGLGLRRWRRMTGVIARSAPAPDAIETMAADLAGRLGIRSVPEVRISGEVETPLVTGAWRPIVLLPAHRFPRLPLRQQQMALCHELAHVKRGDLWLGCVPALVERIFFFHPLVHVAVREYVFWRESACDAVVLAALDAAPQEYGGLLLALGVTRPRTTLAAAGASWSFSSLKRRIVMLPDPSVRSAGSRVIATAVVGLSAAALVPVQLAARKPAAASSPTVATATLAAFPSVANEATAGTAASMAPATTGRLEPAVEDDRQKERELNFVIFISDDRTTMSGSREDIRRARQFKRGGEPLLWFRHAGREYVVRDPAVLEAALAIWDPVNAVGDEQGKLGEEQGKLGARQGELGAKQGEIGALQGRLGARQGVLGARQAALAAQESWRSGTPAQREAFEKERREIELEMRELDGEMRALDPKMRELDAPMRELDEQMEVLGKEMEILGRKMESASRKANAEMRALVERAVATGAAEVAR